MEVREVAGPSGALAHLVPTVWRADAATLCILLDNPKSGHWLVISLDVRDEPTNAPATTHQREAS